MKIKVNHLENLPWEVRQTREGFHVVDSKRWEVGTWDSLEFAQFIKSAPDQQAALKELVADERKFVTCYREAVDSYFAICNFCGAQHNDEYQIEHEPDCPIQQARTILATLEVEDA